jgi:hypothetical protein
LLPDFYSGAAGQSGCFSEGFLLRRLQLAGNTAERNSGTRAHQPSLLAGMLFDAAGNRMTPSYAVKKGTRYRYYVSRPLITKDQTERSTGLRIPAAEFDHLVTSRVRQWLLDPGGIYRSIRLPDPSAQRRLIARAAEIGNSWTKLPGTRQRALLTALIDRIDVSWSSSTARRKPCARSFAAMPNSARCGC